MPPFRLAANIGLVLFLFLTGLEIDLTYLLRNFRTAASVAALDMAIPFACGVGLACTFRTVSSMSDTGLTVIM